MALKAATNRFPVKAELISRLESLPAIKGGSKEYPHSSADLNQLDAARREIGKFDALSGKF